MRHEPVPVELRVSNHLKSGRKRRADATRGGGTAGRVAALPLAARMGLTRNQYDKHCYNIIPPGGRHTRRHIAQRTSSRVAILRPFLPPSVQPGLGGVWAEERGAVAGRNATASREIPARDVRSERRLHGRTASGHV